MGRRPLLFWHPELQLSCVVHGDDFTCLGIDSSLMFFERTMQHNFDCKLKGRLCMEPGDRTPVRVLNRIDTATDAGLEYEPDPLHTERLREGLSPCKLNPVSTPCTKGGLADEHEVNHDIVHNHPVVPDDEPKGALVLAFPECKHTCVQMLRVRSGQHTDTESVRNNVRILRQETWWGTMQNTTCVRP